MFDQKPMPNQANQSGPVVPAPPANLPVASQVQPTKEPEDILADVDGLAESVQRPSQPLGLEPFPPAVPPPVKAEVKEPFFKRQQKVLVMVLIIGLSVAVLAVAGWYGYNQFFVPQTANPVNPVAPKDTNSVPTDQGTNQGAAVTNQDQTNQGEVTNQNPVNNNVEPPVVIDTDRDGLPDAEEALYGTDPNKVDTDSDGLTDRDEVKVFKTDPNNADTDGDGYTDGDEVRSGYDPKGPGRLLKIE